MIRKEGESAAAFSQRLYEENRRKGVETLRPKTAEFLLSLAKKERPSRILEIGTAEGATAVALLCALPEARITTVELSEERFLAARENLKEAGVDSRVRQFFGDAREAVSMMDKPFDLILLDGPKGMYGEWYEKLISLLGEGGVLFADDLSFHGYMTGERSYRTKHGAIIRSLSAFLKKAEEDARVTSQLYSEEDGFLVVKKK